VINRADDGGWHGEVVTFGWLPQNLRRGIRFEQGQAVVPIEAAFDVNGGVPIEVAPAPVPSSFDEPPVVPSPNPEPTTEPTLLPTPEPTPEATQTQEPIVIPEIVVPEILPEPVLELIPEEIIVPDVESIPEVIALDLVPDLEPIIEPVIEPTIEELTQEVIDDALSDGVLTDDERELVADALLEEFSEEAITFEALQEAGLDFEDLPPETPVTLENGVVLTAEVADALEIFDSGAEVLATLLENPAKALKALVSIGQDMTTEERETAQNTVVAAVVVTQVSQVRKMK
jgi:hypothetical protein